MKRHKGLIAVNLVLLGILSAVTFAPSATAQNERTRGRGEYTMVGGSLESGVSDGIYVIDSANAEMIMLRWDNSRKQLTGVGFRDLDADSKAPIRR